MGAIADLWSSERGLLALALIIAATTLAALKIITTDQWTDLIKWIFVTYATAKTVTGSVAILKSGGSSGTPASAAALPSQAKS